MKPCGYPPPLWQEPLCTCGTGHIVILILVAGPFLELNVSALQLVVSRQVKLRVDIMQVTDVIWEFYRLCIQYSVSPRI